MNGVPNQMTLYAYPMLFHESMKALMGVYAQDQWTLKRLTVSGGLRFDYENAYIPAQHLDAGAFIPARDYDQVDCVPCWTDFSPRFSAAYDLFGNAKTAVKVSVGRYMAEEILTTAHDNNPLLASNPSTTRAWNDSFYPVGDPRRGNYIPGLQLQRSAPERRMRTECQHELRQGGGQQLVRAGASERQPALQLGGSTSIQHELRTGVALGFGYFRTSWRNFTFADSQNVTPSDFDPFCVTVPNNPMLPNAGQPLCGLYNITPGKFGQDATNLVTRPVSGAYSDVYNGIDLTINARLRPGAFIQGGLSTGSEVTNSCDAIDSPSSAVSVVTQPPGQTAASLTTRPLNPTDYCRVTPPFWLPQYKFSGSYPLPYAFQFERGLSEPARHSETGQPGGHQRAGDRARTSALGKRRQRHRRQHHRADDAVRGSAESARRALHQKLQDFRRSGSRERSTSTTCSTAPPCSPRTISTARPGEIRPRSSTRGSSSSACRWISSRGLGAGG